MENRLVKSGGTEKSKKSKSPDTQSICRNGGYENGKRKVSLNGDGDLGMNRKKKKSRKDEFLRSFEVVDKRSGSSFDKARGDGSSSNKSPYLEGKLDILLSLDRSGNATKIPKRPRGSVGNKKSESNLVLSPPSVDKVDDVSGEQVFRRMRLCGGKSGSIEKIAKSNGCSLKGKGKLGVDGNKKSSRMTLARVSEEGEVHLDVNSNGNASSSRKLSSKNKRRSGGELLLAKVEPADDISLKMLVNSHDEDEENLEQNAARMLSSRFDPSCTQFSSKSSSLSTNGLSSFMPFDEDFVSRGISVSAGSELASSDLDNRVLRPRKKHKGDDNSRKRRHFYEIFAPDLDAYWVVNRRIKVFWPLDETWYYGLVSGYSPVSKLHHIKYDDREEEWIDLQNEKFKLLLLPNEVPHKAELKGDAEGNKNDEGEEKNLPPDYSLESSYMDSEPIISWLVPSSRRVKSSHLGSSKRHKTSHLLLKSSQKLSKKAVNTKERLEKSDYSKKNMNKLNHVLALSDRSSDPSMVGDFRLEGSSPSRDENIPIVYVRRRFRKKNNGLIDTDKKACGHTLVSSMTTVLNVFDPSREKDIHHGLEESERLLLSVDKVGLLKLTISFLASKKLKLELGFPVSSIKTFEAEDSWLFQAIFMLKFGVVMNTWPKVRLEILFVDNIVGLRFLLFEGSLKQAVQFVLLVVAVFYRAGQKVKPVDMLMPVTSIRFKLSCLENSRKHYVFAVYSFSEVKCSKWLYINSKLQQHCLLAKQLPLSECTYDNIKALESGNNQLPLSFRSQTSSANEDFWKKSLHGIIPKGDLIDSSVKTMDWSPCNYNLKRGNLLPFALAFSTAPSFFLSLHMKLLMENNVASINLHEDESRYSRELSEKSCHPIARGCTVIQEYSTNVLETSLACSPRFSSILIESLEGSCFKPTLGLKMSEKRSDHGQLLSNHQNGKFDVADISASPEGSDKNAGDEMLPSLEKGHGDPKLKQLVTSMRSLVSNDNYGLSVELLALQPDERPVVASNMSNNVVRSLRSNGPRLMCFSDKNNLISSHLRAGGKPEFIRNGFSSGPKKPRTQVQYILPSGGLDSILKHNLHNHRGFPFHRIRKANDKRASEVSKKLQRNKFFLGCDANVLITNGGKGWRECGACVELENAEHNEWNLAVKLSGTTKFSYKAYQFLQPGSTNRYTHAMMWRGGKDWVLEFPDRNQWMLFKEMHEECFNRNLRAASVKNIPIPGVRLIEECDSYGTEFPFVRSSSNYFCQVETDAEMAMDPSRVLYDMDSEDEMWISGHQKMFLVNGREFEEITEESFESTMDMLEKVAFAQQRVDFHLDEIEEFMVEFGPMESIRTIHEHWQRKRLRKGMPLIRHLQPPLWESYVQRVKEWEQAVAGANSALSSRCHGRAPPLEKPPMFAFCLKPRGLEIPNKGTKQRSHRRYPVSGSSYSLLSDHDGLYTNGRRSNGYAYFGDEKVMYLGNTHEYSDTSPPFKSPRTAFSPRDAGEFGQLSINNDMSERNQYQKYHTNKSKNVGFFRSPNNLKVLDSYNQKTIGKRNGVNRLNMSLPQWPNQRQHRSELSLRYGLEKLDGSDLDELRLRDASAAAQHALNMARLKREKAHKLLYRADLATHKAMAALMTAEAIKASFEDLSDDDLDDDEITEDDFSSDDESINDSNDNSSDSDRTR